MVWNAEQSKTAVRWFVATFGGAVAGFIAGKGWASANDVLGVLTSDSFIQGVGALVSLSVLVIGLVAKTIKNQTQIVSQMPHVAGVITEDTPEGRKIAAAVPSSAVSVAGSDEAKIIAATGVRP